MNVGQLKEALDDYGDHLEVVVVDESGEFTRVFEILDVGDTTTNDGVRVDLGVEL